MLQRMLQLNPLLPVDTPIGPAMAHAMIDYGEEHHIYFVCFIDVGGECHIFKNTDVNLQKNESLRPRQWDVGYWKRVSSETPTEPFIKEMSRTIGRPYVPGELHGQRDY